MLIIGGCVAFIAMSEALPLFFKYLNDVVKVNIPQFELVGFLRKTGILTILRYFE